MQKHRQQLDTDELPIVLEDTDRKYVAIESGKCGQCGYDRVKVAHNKYGGVTQWTCKNCGATKDERSDEWRKPESDSDRLRDLRRYAEIDGPVVKYGEFGTRSRFTHGHEVFGYDDGTGLFKVYRHGRNGTNGSLKSIREDTLRGLMSVLESEEGYVTDWIDEQFSDVEKAIHVASLLPEGLSITSDE